jgi:hypothetical protein
VIEFFPSYPCLTAGNCGKKQHLSLDKISIVFDFKRDKMIKVLKILAKNSHKVISSEHFFQSYVVDDVLYQWDYKHDINTLVDKLRIEYNPCKLQNFDVLSMVINGLGSNVLKGSTITRLDVAIDYPFRINPLQFYSLRKRKSGYFSEKGFGIQTIYLGSKSSGIFYRIYDKKTQLKQVENVDILEDNLWRVEAQDRRGFYFLQEVKNFFVSGGKDDLVYVQIPEIKKGFDIFFNDFCARYGVAAALSYLSVEARRYKLANMEMLDLSPARDFDDQFPFLWSKFKQQLLLMVV